MRPFILAFHRLRRTPGFTLSALLVLALGIGVNVLLVSSFRGSLDQSPSFRDPARVLMIRTGTRQQRPDWRQLAAIQVNELRAQTRTLDAWVGVRDSLAMLQLDGQGERIPVGLVTLGGLSSLGVPFELGRDLTDPEGVLLSHGAWVRRFGQDPGVLGRSLWVDGKARRVAGVLAQGVRLPWMLERSEAFLPLTFSPEEASNRDSGACWVFAHLCPGQSLQAAQRELAQLAPVVASSAQREEAWTLTAETISAMALKDSLSEILVLGLAGGFLLLLVCANVAGLFLARLETRARESALRSALGASRASLLWDQGRECLLLGAGAVGLGTALVLLGSRLLGGALGPIHLDAGLALTAVLLGLATTLGTSLAPVWLGSRVDLRTLLSQGGAGNLGSGLGWRKGLVVAQLALTSLLLTGTGLAGQLLRHMQNTDPGLNVNQVIAVDYQLPSRLAGEGGSAVNLALLRQLEAQPGVQAAALASAMPLYHRGDTARIWAERAAESSVNASCEQVSSAYFQTLGIALRQGRALDDRREDECVVSESLARRLWPTAGPAGPLGQRLSVQGSHGRWLTLVGVVADHRHNGLDCVPVDQIFTPCASYAQVTLLVRSAWTPAALRGALKASAPDLEVSSIRTLKSVADRAFETPRALRLVLAGAGLFAALLAGLGLYGMASSLAIQRTREFGLRHALGATRGRLVAAALRESFRHTGLGFLLGEVAAVNIALLLRSQLQGVSVLDLPLFLGVAFLLALLTLIAGLLPALRASRVNPAEALRAD